MPRTLFSNTLILAFGLALFVFTNEGTTQDEMDYPKTKKVDQVDTYFEAKVVDDYRWLEDDVRESDDVKNWVEAQNELTMGYLESLPHRKEIEERLTKLWDYEKYGTPFKAGGRYYYSKNDGLQNQSVVYRMDSLDSEPTVLMDPNKWSEDGTVALGGMAFSDDGKYVAYGVQESGSDWRTWHVMEIETGKKLADKISWVKFGGADWSADSKGFFYNRYDEPTEGEAFQSLNKNQKVYYHELGYAQSEDVLIHKDDNNPEWGFSPSVTEDGNYLVLTVWKGTDDRYRILYKSLTDPDSKMVELIDDFSNEFSYIGNEGTLFYFKSDVDAPKKCILTIDIANPARENWKVIIPEAEEAMESAGMVGDNIIVEYLKDAKTQVKLFNPAGEFVREVSFPGIGSANGFGGKRTHKETFYSFSSFNRPPSTYRYDLATGESKLIREAKVAFNPDDFEVSQVFYTAKTERVFRCFLLTKKESNLTARIQRCFMPTAASIFH